MRQSWEEELGQAIFRNIEDRVRERYIQIRRNRLGGMFPEELMMEVSEDVVVSLNALTFLLTKGQYQIVREEVLKEVDNLMCEVEGIL